MRDKKWINCPSCGASNSMVMKKNRRQTFRIKGYPPLCVKSLEGYVCRRCKDGIYSRASARKIEAEVVEHRAKYDATRTFVSALMLVGRASHILHVSRQAVYKMMREGRLAFVFIDDLRFPLRAAVMRYRQSRQR